ncbi:MAG: TPR end-of-group domain-containing protein [Actinomycetota bacterium]
MTDDLGVIAEKMTELYQQERYEEALDLSRSVEERFPANAAYWNACLLSVMGHADEALHALERGLEQGVWWAPDALLRDPDLEPIRASNRFERIVEASERSWRAAFRDHPDVLTFPPQTKPTGGVVIALHGSPGQPADIFAEHWRPVTSDGAALVVPQSTQPHNSEGGRSWHDRARTQRDLEIAYHRAEAQFAIDPSRVVVAGFSAGGHAAVTLALTGRPFRVAGFIVVAPAIRPDVADNLDQADPHPRGWITVGENDWVREDSVTLYDRARAKGFPWHIEIIEGLGHEFPDDFHSQLIEALDFILANGA